MILPQNNRIIPVQLFNDIHSNALNKEAIAFFVSSGFFMENDTFWKGASWNYLDFDNQPWKHEPMECSLAEAVNQFANLFHNIVDEQTGNAKVVLGLSGGLDSRTLAVAMQVLGKTPHTYSYRFESSFEETMYGRKIANALDWKFDELTIPPGYLWDKIEEAGRVNHCYTEFTQSRQVAVAEKLSEKGDLWLLGHWGDVLFDDMGINDALSVQEQVNVLYKKILKKGGKELATDLWNAWELPESFEKQLHARLTRMHSRIEIANANARVRAFKSLYWATRWTSTYLSNFNKYKPMALPYYDDRMCRFVMSMPEKHLAARQIQIEYIKKYSPQLAKIPWQAKAPYNLYNINKHKTLVHKPYLVLNKTKRVINETVFGKKLIERNWEIQFLGKVNEEHLRQWLFENKAFARLVPKEITNKYYRLFKSGNQVYWSHPVSMLLTLSVFSKQNEFTL